MTNVKRRLVLGGGLGIAAVALVGVACVSQVQAPAERPAVSPPDHLRGLVESLAKELGPRSPHEDALAQTAAFVRKTWTEQGFTVRDQPYDCGDGRVLNLEVVLPGSDPALGQIVVGAHYDTVVGGTPGADDNASGVALLLTLSDALRGSSHARTIRLVAFTCEEPPYFQTETMGSYRYARDLAAQGVEVAAMVSLESIGFFSAEPGSQHYPPELADRYPSTGNFACVVGNLESARLVDRFADALAKGSTVPVERGSFPGELEGVGWSDHWSFWQIDVPAVMLTDTAPFRNPHYHRATDTPDTLDYVALAAVSQALRGAVLELAGP